MCIEELGNELVARRCDPRRIFTIQSPDSNKIEQADVIVEFTYMSPGEVIDAFYDEFSVEDVRKVDEGQYSQTMNYGGARQMLNRDLTIDERYGLIQGELYLTNNNSAYFYGSPYDRTGNIRVMRVCWKSRRKMGKLKYYDEYGQEQYELVDESVKDLLGPNDSVEWFYINEWWEGTKIGTDTYKRVRPIPYQGRSMNNLSVSTPPYVGVFMNSGGNNRAFSLMDKLKPLDYLYDIYSYRRELAMAAYHGPILAFNASMIPSEWDAKDWMYYVTTMKLMPLDPTNEIFKGPAQGKSAGAFNTLTAQAINLEMGNFIQQHTLMMEGIKRDMDIISGVNDYRQGEIKADSAVGTAEMAYTASNSMTEKIFHIHSSFKRRVMVKLLEVGKYVWKKNPQRCQFILDDMGTEIINSLDDFFESEYDIHVANSSSDEELMQALKGLSHAAMQNGQASFKNIIDIYRTDSIAAVARKLEDAEEQAMQRAQEAQQREFEAAQQLKQMEAADKQEERELRLVEMENENMNKQLDREAKIQIEIIKALGYAQETDIDGDMIPDVIEQGKLALEQTKLAQDRSFKERELNQRQKEAQKKTEIEEKNLKLKEKELVLKKELQASQERQMKLQNANQEKLAKMKLESDKLKIAAQRAQARARSSK